MGELMSYGAAVVFGIAFGGVVGYALGICDERNKWRRRPTTLGGKR